MMYYMTSKTLNLFLNKEDDDDILNSQYVIISTRIRVRKSRNNILMAKNVLFPNSNVLSALTEEDIEERYSRQLKDNDAFICSLIKGSIDEGYNIIFLCTKNEGKIKYLEYLAKHIFLEYGYPVYEYKKYALGISPLIKYNKNKILKRVDEVLKKAKTKSQKTLSKNENGRKQLMKEYSSMKKSELKKILQERDLYQSGIDKDDMLEIIEIFM